MREELRWDLDVEIEMNKYLGGPLPFVDLNPDTMYHHFTTTYEYYYGFDLYVIGDDNDYNLVADYGAKLEAAGFEYNPGAAVYGGDYIKTTPRGYQIEVSFAYFEATSSYDAGNEIDVYMPPYVDPYSDEWFLDNGYELVNGYPKEHVDFTLGNSDIAGVNLEGEFYEKFGKTDAGDKGVYYYDLFATEGEFGDAMIAQIEAAGYEYDDYYECWFDENEDCELHVDERDGWTAFNFYGPYLDEPYEESHFTENGYTKYDAYPQELMDAAFAEENHFAPVNADGTWFVKATKTKYNGGAQYKYSGYLYTAGDFTEELGENLLAAGFIWEDYYEDYELPDDYMVYLTVSYGRGYTKVYFNGPKLDDPDYVPPVPVAFPEVADAIDEYFADYEIETNAPDYYAAEECEVVASAGTIRIYDSVLADMKNYETALKAAGWTTEHPSASWPDDFKAYFGETGACLTIEEYSSYIKIACSYEVPVPPMTAADATAAILASWEDDFDLDVTDVILPDYETANGSFEASDAYVATSGFFLVIIDGTTAEEMAAYVADLKTAGWDCEAYANANGSGYACSFGAAGEVPAMEVQDHLASGYVAILAYSTFKIGDITSLSVIQSIANMIGGNVEDLGNDWYGVEGDYYASSTPLSTIKGWIVDYFTPDSFELIEDWETTTLTDGTPAETCTYYDEDADVVLEYTVFNWTSGTTEVSSFMAIAYPGNAE